MIQTVRRALLWLAAAGFGGGAVLAAGLLYAETVARQDSPTALQRAMWIENRLAGAPNADHQERLAEILSEMGSGPPEPALREAVRLDPRRGAAWLTLGLLAERRGDWIEAERDLLEAARIDHQYLPAWTLTNFYFRRGNRDAFWEWARRAAVRTYDEFPPLMRLADHFDQDPSRVLERLGDGVRIERGYLTYLIGRHRLDSAQSVALRLAARRDASDASRFADLASRQIAAGHPGAALEAWNVFHIPALDPAHGRVLTNSDFRSPPTGEGFDWTLGTGGLCPGEAGVWSPGQVRFKFSGGQPDDCMLLTQTLILASHRRYRLKFEYGGEGRPSPSGVDWDLVPRAGPSIPLQSATVVPAGLTTPPNGQKWGASERIFPDTHEILVRLRLMYHRQPGTVRYEGSVWLRDLHLEML